MPPKKDAKKEAVARPDNSGIPKQDVEFKFNLLVKTDAPELPYALMWEWFGATSDKLERNDTPAIDAWQKVEGGFALEKVCDLIRVDDDFCRTLSSRRFYLYFVNGDNNKVEDSLYFDYSSLLAFKGDPVEPSYSFTSTTIRVMGIDSFQLKLTANKQLLQDLYRHYLNPFEVEVIGARDVPADNHSKYVPSYVRYTFFDGVTVETNPLVGQDTLVWNHKHVFLAGLIDPAVLREKLRFGYVKFELHDRDEVQNKKIKEDTQLFDLSKAIVDQIESQKPVQEDPKKKGAVKKEPEKKQAKKEAKKEAKKKDIKLGEPILPEKMDTLQNNYGVAAFYLVDFLKNSMRSARYKAPVVPRVTFEDFESRNIDLNTTARNEMQKVISSNNYFERDTSMAVGFTIAYPIGTFVKPAVPQPAVVEDPKKKKDAKEPVNPAVQSKSEPAPAVRKDVFERVVYVIPYKSPELVKKIDEVFYEANIKAFELKNKRQVTTFLLKPADKASHTLDFMTGVQLIDNESRIYILEGLRDGAMKKLHSFMVKTAPNTKQFKILKNSNITFLNRLYTEFNIELKRLRFRPSLTQLLLDPIIYIKSKVPEEISKNLNRISEIKKICDDLKSVDSMNLWPDAEQLVQIQRKFSDSITYEDIHGVEEEKKKKGEATLNQTLKEGKTINFMTQQDLKHVTMQELTLPKINTTAVQQQMSQSLPNVNHIFTKRGVETKTFMKDQSKFMKTYDMKLKKAEVALNEPVYIYAGQKNNWYQKQMREMREKINTDKNHVYTYSNDYLGLTIDPRNEDEERKKEKTFAQTKNISPNKFSSLVIKTKEERMKLPKGLSHDEIEEIRNNPYHVQKSMEKDMKRNTRDLPLNSDKPEFQKYIKKPEYFSVPEVVESERITPAERFKMEQEEKKRLEEENRKKLLGDATMKIKKGYSSNVTYGVDRFKDIRQGSPEKKGLIDINKKTKQKKVIEPYEVSYQLKEEKIDPGFNPLVRQDRPGQNTSALEFNNYQRPEVLTMTSVAKPLKKADF